MRKAFRTEEEKKLVQQVSRKITKLKRRFNKIEGAYGKDAVTYAMERYQKKPSLSTTKGKTAKELKAQLKELDYIASLKSSSVKGMKEVNKFKEINKDLKGMSKHREKRFWTIYQNLVEDNGIWDKYKYQVMDIVKDAVANRKQDKTIFKTLDRLYEQSQLQDRNLEEVLNEFDGSFRMK